MILSDHSSPRQKKMDGLPPLTATDSPSMAMDLETHLRGMILSNSAPIADSTVGQHSNQGHRHQADGNSSQRTDPARSHSQSRAETQFAAPRHNQLSQPTRRHMGGQAHGAQLSNSSTPADVGMQRQLPKSGGHSASPTPTQAQLSQTFRQPARVGPNAGSGSSMQTSNANVPQRGYPRPQPNPGVSRIQQPPNGQQKEPRYPYANARNNLAMPKSNIGPNPRNSQFSRGPPAEPVQYSLSNNQNQNQNSQYPRPIPQNRQLYEPGNYRSRGYNQYHQQIAGTAMRVQAEFLDQLAAIEIPKAAITSDELQEKEALRLVLQEICRKTIAEHEVKTEPAFDGSSITLSCFGSLASGYATHSADMDLALASPLSEPEASSPESKIPRLLEKALLDLGYGVRLLTRTRVPIIKFCQNPTPELAAKLLEERIKYEKERDAPPKPSREKKVQEKKTGDTKQAPNKEKQVMPKKNSTQSDVPQAMQQIPPLHTTDLQHTSSVIDDLDDAAIDELKTNHSSNVTLQDPGLVETPQLPQAKDVEATASAKPENATDLSLFSDEELIRLYDLAIKEGWYEFAERAKISNFKQAVARDGPNNETQNLKVARLNLQTLTDVLKRYRAPPEHHLEFPKLGVGIQCDINFSNPLALHNTRLLKCYGICDSRIRPMVLFVKAWAKRRKINSPYDGTLSSYGYVLMVLHYLVNVIQPAVAPNLQITRKAVEDKSPQNNIMIDGYNVRFWQTENEIADFAKRGMLTQNHDDTVGSLLRGFFQYFAQPHVGFSWSTDVLSLRSEGGLLSKAQKGWIGAKSVITESKVPGDHPKEIRHRYLFAIEDPFEIDHNVARTVVHNGIIAIRDEFRRAHRITQSVGYGDGRVKEELFAEGESKEKLQYRAFGPMPRRDTTPVDKSTKETDSTSRGKAKETTAVSNNKKTVDELVGNSGQAKVKFDSQTPPKPVVGCNPGTNKKDSKLDNITNGKAQVVPERHDSKLKPSIGSNTANDKAKPGKKELANRESVPRQGSRKIESSSKQATGLGIERDLGTVYKNGKEVPGLSGRVGEAGVIPKRRD